MTSKAVSMVACSPLVCGTARGQEGASAPAEVTPHIQNVIAGRTTVWMVAEFKGAINGLIALPDGIGVLVAEIAGIRTTKIDNTDKTSVSLDKTNGALCLAVDAKGRLLRT